jgi:hypothetical protein
LVTRRGLGGHIVDDEVLAGGVCPEGVAPGWLGGNVSFKSAAAVPAPLPQVGIAAAFGFSRQLRQRIKTASQP